MKKRAALLSLLIALVFGSTAAFATPAKAPAPYTLKQQLLAKDAPPTSPYAPRGKVRLVLMPANGGKPVWTQTVADPQNITWSSNGRALALCFQPYPAMDPPQTINLLFWREGYPVRVFHAVDFGSLDSLWRFQFSPDGREVAFLGGSGGDIVNDSGTLYIYDSARNRLISGVEDEIRRFRWVDSKTVQYWPLENHSRISPDGRPVTDWRELGPKLWHLPG